MAQIGQRNLHHTSPNIHKIFKRFEQGYQHNVAELQGTALVPCITDNQFTNKMIKKINLSQGT